MEIARLDWIIITVSVAVCFIPALFYARRAGKNVSEFFASGRSVPWWLVGISMVATTFSTDTPNLVTDIVRQNGIAGNWIWWAFLLTGMATVFLYARMWRRSGVLTDLEFYEIRYSGKAASTVRGFRALYLGLMFNCVIMATVNLAMVKIANVVLGWPAGQTLILCGVINIFFAATSGLWGVLVIDMIQFGIAMTGAFSLAYFALQQPQVGGLAGLVDKLPAETMSFLPDFSNWELALTVLIIPIAIQWWSVWYPGAEPGGGSYIAQRMLASKSERDALGGTLFFNAAHYALRPWPWIVVALASLLVYPELADIKKAFPDVDPSLINHDMAYPAMLRFLPAGFLGIMIAGLLAAYVSTMITHLNWGTSYLVHDFYRRFFRADASEKHYVAVGRVATAALMMLAGLLTLVLESAKGSFDLLLSVGAGTGLIYLLRWFWWRINAWSEISAMISSFVITAVFFILRKGGVEIPTHYALIGTITATTVVWLVVTYLTPETDRNALVRFYKLVRPAGPGWAEIRKSTGIAAAGDSLPMELLGWTVGTAAIWSALFSTGSFLFGHPAQGFVLGAICLVSTVIVVFIIRRLWTESSATG
jgi:Na+/proline symporter